MLGLQYNRALVRKAINLFFTGDPKEHPDLAAVHKAMGLSGRRQPASARGDETTGSPGRRLSVRTVIVRTTAATSAGARGKLSLPQARAVNNMQAQCRRTQLERYGAIPLLSPGLEG